jgi:hypothetical protein
MRELGELPEEARELAMSRFRLIQPHLEKNRPLQIVAADGEGPVPNCTAVGEPIPQIRLESACAQNTG